MASLEDVFNGDFGKKDNKKPLLSKDPQIKVFHSPPAPIEEVISEPVTPYSATPVFGSTTPVVSEKYDYADLSKEELLIIIQADRFLNTHNVTSKSKCEVAESQMFEEKATPMVKSESNMFTKSKQPIKWREYGGWWLSTLLTVILIGLIVTVLGR
jgi:hypothetical protein